MSVYQVTPTQMLTDDMYLKLQSAKPKALSIHQAIPTRMLTGDIYLKLQSAKQKALSIHQAIPTRKRVRRVEGSSQPKSSAFRSKVSLVKTNRTQQKLRPQGWYSALTVVCNYDEWKTVHNTARYDTLCASGSDKPYEQS